MHLNSCAMVHSIERGDIPVVEEYVDYHYKDAAMGRRSKQALTGYERHYQEDGTYIENDWLSRKRANYGNLG